MPLVMEFESHLVIIATARDLDIFSNSKLSKKFQLPNELLYKIF